MEELISSDAFKEKKKKVMPSRKIWGLSLNIKSWYGLAKKYTYILSQKSCITLNVIYRHVYSLTYLYHDHYSTN